MKKSYGWAMGVFAVLLLGSGPAWALSAETTMLLDLLKAKGVITQQEAAEFTQALEAKSALEVGTEDEHYHSVQSLSDRVDRLEGKGGEGSVEPTSHLNLGGRLAVDLTSGQAKAADGVKINSSDVVLDTAQLTAEATVNQYVTGRLTLLYEEGANNDNLALDEAIIGVKGGEDLPVYANLGRQYVPFGQFKSHFISDPQTKILGETNDTALVAGYANDIVDLQVGALRGKVREMSTEAQINSAVASAMLSWPQGVSEGLVVKGGFSYLTNLAASDGLEGETTNAGEVVDMVGGVSAFLSLAYAERFFFDAEYLAALDDFASTDFTFADPEQRQPRTWNLEAAARFNQTTEFALRYGGSNDAVKNQVGDAFLLADHEYGAALLYDIFTHTSLTVEYLFQKFQDDSDNRQATLQVAVEF